MSKSDAFEAALLDLLFLNIAMPNIGDAAGLRATTTAGQLFFSLHTADPGEAGAAQTTNEVSYTGYARIGVARGAGGFVRSGNVVTPVANVDFAGSTGGSGNATHFAIGTAATGAGMILYKGAITPTIAFAPGSSPPRILSSTSVTED